MLQSVAEPGCRRRPGPATCTQACVRRLHSATCLPSPSCRLLSEFNLGPRLDRRSSANLFRFFPFTEAFMRVSLRVVCVLCVLILRLHAQKPASKPAPPKPANISGEAINAVPFRMIGPASPAGRVWHITGVPQQPKTFYVCTADGGVWKTTNFGTTMVPIFNDQPAASCGPIAVGASDPNVVWVGTGEPASTRANSLGRGVFKSADGGKTWQAAGLEDTEEIGAIVIDPRNPQTVYVGAMGHLWGRSIDRGVFKTTDGGKTWSKVLFVNDTTGAIDLKMDPKNPDVLYAGMWQRIRWGDGDMTESGPGSGIYKSTDAGAHWTRLTDGLPTEAMGKVTIAVAQNNSQIVYAAILTGEPLPSLGGPGGKRTSDQGGVFRSEDGGAHWQRVNPIMTSYYYDVIVADPKDDNRVWMPVFELMRSDDGGRTWVKHNMKHV